MKKVDWAVLLLGICLIVVVAGIVAIVHRDGVGQLKGSGLGALAAVLAGALAWRVRSQSNGNGES